MIFNNFNTNKYSIFHSSDLFSINLLKATVNRGRIKWEEWFIMRVRGVNLCCMTIYRKSRFKVILMSYDNLKKSQDFKF